MNKKAMVLAIFLLAAVLASAAPAGAREMRFVLGMVNGYDGPYAVVNEGTKISTTGETEYFNSSGNPVEGQTMRRGGWVYVEGYVGARGVVEAERVFFLPGYVGRSERGRYPFIQIP